MNYLDNVSFFSVKNFVHYNYIKYFKISSLSNIFISILKFVRN